MDDHRACVTARQRAAPASQPSGCGVLVVQPINKHNAMKRNKRNNDGYQGKVEFWEDQLALAKQAKEFALVDHSRYSLERCRESLAYFKGKRAAYLEQKAKSDAPMMPRPEDAHQRALDACRSKFEGLSESERLMLANKFITDGLGVGIPLNNTMAFLQEAGVISDTELMHSITF